MTDARLDTWRAGLAYVLSRYADAAFAWGRMDCFMMAGDAAMAVYGADPTAPYRTTYTDGVSALRRVREAGYSQPGDVFAEAWRMLGDDEPARPGDVIELNGEGPCAANENSRLRTLGVMVGPAHALTFGPTGLIGFERGPGLRVFRGE